MKRPLLLIAASVAWSSSALAAGTITKGPWLQHVTSTSAIVRVEVDPPAPLTLELATPGDAGGDAGGTIIESKEVRALHSVLVKGLAPATRYPFTIRAHGTPRQGAITTAPADDSGAPFRFLVYGDNRSDDAAHAAVVKAMVPVKSEFLVNTGDFVESGGSLREWQTFFDIEAPLTNERPIFSCVGNHELTEGAGIEYVRYLGPAALSGANAVAPTTLSLEQLSGTFRWSNARFFLVNGMVDYRTGPSREWLGRVLSEADNEAGLVWRIVVVHHGPWSSGPHGDNARFQDANIPGLLRTHKVDLVISGHDHIYERGIVDGLPYIVSGGGGAPTYRVKKPSASSRRVESVRHFVEAAASPTAIQFVATRPDGSTIERCGLKKSVGWDCDGEKSAPTAASAASASSESSSSSSSSTGPAPSSRCACRTAGSEGSSGGAAILIGVLAVLTAFARRLRNSVILR